MAQEVGGSIPLGHPNYLFKFGPLVGSFGSPQEPLFQTAFNFLGFDKQEKSVLFVQG